VPGIAGKVFGLTRGPRAHFFVYHDFPQEDCVIPLGVVAENAAAGCLAVARDGWVYGVVSSPQPGREDFATVFFRYDPSSTSISSEYNLKRGKPEWLPSPFGARRVPALIADKQSDLLYGLLAPGNIFFSYDPALGKLSEFGAIGENHVSEVLCLAQGAVYGVGPDGRIFRFDTQTGRMIQRDMVLPCQKGKEFVNKANALIYDPTTNRLYGGTSPDGYLFRVELDEERVISLGKPLDQSPIRCMALGGDGTVYGAAGEPRGGICHLFRYLPDSGDLRDLGVPRATISKCWIAHEIDTMCTNRNGHIVMGENDRISHLFVYFPPIRRMRASRTP